MLTLHYQRPIDEKQSFPLRTFEGDKLLDETRFHPQLADFDYWDSFVSEFDHVVSFANLHAHTGEQVEK